MIRLSLLRRSVVTAVFAILICIATGAYALITGGYGNDPVPDHNWPDGTLAIANHKSRLGWWEGPPFGGGQFTFLFRGDAKAFNEALELFSKINAPAIEVHVHAGPHEDFWLVDREEKKEGEKKRDPRIDWSFTVWSPQNFHHLYNNPTSLFSSDRPEFRRGVPPPKIDVYLGGGLIEWKDVKVPDKVRVVGKPADALKDQPPRLRLHAYDMMTSKPIAGAKVKLVSYGKDGQKDAGQTTTDEHGEAAFDNLKPTTYDVRLEAEGYAPRSLGWEQYAKGDDKTESTELSPQATVTGRVVNAKDQPIADAKVHTFVVLGFDGRGYPLPERAEVKTDAQGSFEMKLPTGYVQLSARSPGMYHSWTEILPVGERLISGIPSEPLIIRMAQTTTVTINVTDAAGKPTAGQNVSLEPTGNPIGKWSSSATTDAKGKAVIEGVPPGEYQVTDRAYPPKKGKGIRVEEGQPAKVAVSW